MPLPSGELQVDAGDAHGLGRSPAPHAKLNVRLRADAVIPVSARPIANGAVLIDDRGKITAVGPNDDVPRPRGVRQLDFHHAALIPGLINVHTHLELTDLGGPIAAPNFYEWIQTVRREVAARTHESLLESSRRGVLETWRCGTTTVADTGSTGTVAQALAEMSGRGIVYQEVFGPHPTDATSALAGLVDALERLMCFASDRVTIGVSPHAPYTVSGQLYRAVAELARRDGWPVAAHIAESVAETELIAEGIGHFGDALRTRGIAPPDRSASPVRYLAEHGLLDTDLLAIHCVQTDEIDCELLATHDCAVAACPTSNRMHGHGQAPLRILHDVGIRLGVGTDSVASVGSMDLFREGRALREALDLTAEETLHALTLGAARVLSMENDVGSLDVGKWGDMTVVGLTEPSVAAAEQVVASSPSEIRATFVAGRCVYERSAHVAPAARGQL